jgi:peptidoglycan/xylan/chitin deacetylase (PgdA/CDA1 family)
VDAARLEDELAGAREIIRRETGQVADEFAYPYGDLNPAVAEAAGRVYRRACTTELRALQPDDDPRRLPRLDMYYLREPGRLEAWGSAAFTGRLWLRARARRLRRLLTERSGG